MLRVSVGSFNSTVRRERSLLFYWLLRLRIYRCVQLNSVLFFLLMRGVLRYKHVHRNCYTLLHRRPSIVDSALQQLSIDGQLFVDNRDLYLPHLHSTPPLGGSPSEYCHDVWCGKTRMVWLPGGEKF